MKNENLYRKFVSKYTDDELLKEIEYPSEIEKDVFNAILTESLNRELISSEQFDELSDSGKTFESDYIESDEEEFNLNTKDFWKCSKCGQTIDMNFDACWNCQNYKPEKIEHPSKAKIIEYQSYKKPTNFIASGLSLIGAGVLFLILSGLLTNPDFFGFHPLQLGRFLEGLVFIFIGVAFTIFGIFRKSEE